MMHRYIRTSEPRPYDSVLFCGICGLEVHVTREGESLEWDDTSVEEAAREHLLERHPRRYRLWQTLGWRWLIGGLSP